MAREPIASVLTSGSGFIVSASQLVRSITPISSAVTAEIEIVFVRNMAPRRGFEPLTCPLGGGRAIQLCHRGGARVRSIEEDGSSFDMAGANPGDSSTGPAVAGHPAANLVAAPA